MSSLVSKCGKEFFGVGINSKKAHGKIRFYDQNIGGVSENSTKLQAREGTIKSAESEKARFFEALDKTVSKTEKTAILARNEIGKEEARIFEIHAMLLRDEDFLESVCKEIEDGLNAEDAVRKSAEKFYQQLRALGDEYLSARASDIKDIASGILGELISGDENQDAHKDIF